VARKRSTRSKPDTAARAYDHPEQLAVLRPDIGIQPQFKKKLPPATYRYDRSLDPELSWDINADREHAESLIAQIAEAARKLEETTDPKEIRNLQSAIRNAAAELRRMSAPFLNWAGKAERHTFTVPTLPLFVHERLSTEAILRSVQTHKQQLDLFADPKLDLAERVLRAYEHKTGWVNRLILGDSLVVMNSLLKYEGLGGQVQCIYVDPPYGVKFGSNFQPFIRKRDVKHNDDADLTREPEMVQAYRDTWELGLHSYLTYLRDRFLLCRELLHPSGSIFVQISDENLHHVRELLDEVFGAECFVVTIPVKKKGSQKSSLLDPVNDYVLWYGKSPRSEGRTKFHQVFVKRELDLETVSEFKMVELPDGREFPISAMPDPSGVIRDYRLFPKQVFADYPGARLFASNPLTSGGERKNQSLPFRFRGQEYTPPKGSCWKTTVRTDDGSVPGMKRLEQANRLLAGEGQLRFKRYLDDFGCVPLSNWWDYLGGASDPLYVVQTNTEIVQRCLLMTTDPGDLVLDPTCGSGTTAYVAEQWGRRWITIDTSRVPLALARQRLLTATFPFYEINANRRTGVRGQGSGVSDQRGGAELSGPGGVAEGHATGPGGLSGDAGVSTGGALRTGQPDAPGGGVGAQQHCGGARAANDRGVSAVPGTGVRLAGGTGDPGAAGAGTGLSVAAGSGGTAAPHGGNEPRAAWSGPFPDPSPLTPAPTSPNNPAHGFVYRRRQNAKGEEVGGIVPHVTLKSIANNEPPEEEVLVDRPEVVKGVVRVTGPFVVEATIPTPVDFEGDGVEDSRAKSSEELASHVERMLEALRRSPVLRLPGNQTVTFKNVRQPAKTLSLHAEAEMVAQVSQPAVSPASKPAGRANGKAGLETRDTADLEVCATGLAAFVFGPENGAVSEQSVFAAAREAYAKSYRHLYVIGFAIQDAATKLIQNCEAVVGIPATYVAATMDLQMADLLKTTRASQIFSVTGAPDIRLRKLAKKSKEGEALYQVELLGLDVFDPVTMETTHKRGDDVPAWFLDTDYNELAFCVAQAFFPRTAAWDNLKRELRGVYADSVWEHLAGTVSEPFAAGEHRQIAVKVIDDRGNELLVVRKLEEAEEA